MSLIPHDQRISSCASIVSDNDRIMPGVSLLFLIVSNDDVVGTSYFMIIPNDMITTSSYIIVIPSNGRRFRIFCFVIGTNDRCIGRIGHFVFVTIDHIVH